MLMNVVFMQKHLIELEKSVNECIFELMSLRLTLMIVYFLVVNSKRCNTVAEYRCQNILGQPGIMRFLLKV